MPSLSRPFFSGHRLRHVKSGPSTEIFLFQTPMIEQQATTHTAPSQAAADAEPIISAPVCCRSRMKKKTLACFHRGCLMKRAPGVALSGDLFEHSAGCQSPPPEVQATYLRWHSDSRLAGKVH